MHAQAMIAAEPQRRVRALQPHSCAPSLLVNTPHPPCACIHPTVSSILISAPISNLHRHFFPPAHIAPILSQLFRLPMLSSKLIHQPRVQSQLVHPPLCLIPIALCTLAKPYLSLPVHEPLCLVHIAPPVSILLFVRLLIPSSIRVGQSFSISPVGSHRLVTSVHWVLSAISIGPPADTALNLAHALLNPTPSP